MIFVPRPHNDMTLEYQQKLVQQKLVDVVFYEENSEKSIFYKNNTGKEFFTFTCVVRAISDYLNTHSTSCFCFTGDQTEPSRIKLYDKMAELFSKRFDYNLRIHKFGRKKVYVLQKWPLETEG